MTSKYNQVRVRKGPLSAVGRDLRARRRAAGYTQEEVAKKIGAGIIAIRRLEYGEPVNTSTLVKYATLFRLKVALQ